MGYGDALARLEWPLTSACAVFLVFALSAVRPPRLGCQERPALPGQDSEDLRLRSGSGHHA